MTCETCGAFLEPYTRCEACVSGEDANGEDYRGGEAAADEREQMAAARRLK